MRKKIYIMLYRIEDSDEAGIAGYWGKPLTEEEQHGYFREHYPRDYDSNGKCKISWQMIELKGIRVPTPLPNYMWSGGNVPELWE